MSFYCQTTIISSNLQICKSAILQISNSAILQINKSTNQQISKLSLPHRSGDRKISVLKSETLDNEVTSLFSQTTIISSNKQISKSPNLQISNSPIHQFINSAILQIFNSANQQFSKLSLPLRSGDRKKSVLKSETLDNEEQISKISRYH